MLDLDEARGFVFAVDGGGTRSRARLFDQAGIEIGGGISGPCNPSTSRARAVESVGDLWGQCCARAGQSAPAMAETTFAIGAAGLYVPETRAGFLAECPAFRAVFSMTDGYAAMIGAGAGHPSALIIAGTGVAGHRLYPDGRSIQRDAWGWVAGDRGSGAWIGRAGLRHAVAALDGVVRRDALADAVLDIVGGPEALAAGWLRDLTPDRLGALAPAVLDAAGGSIASAVTIRARAVEHLAALAGVLDSAEVPLYASGGVADVLRPALAETLRRPVLQSESDALVGCWLVATGRAPAEQADFFGLGESR